MKAARLLPVAAVALATLCTTLARAEKAVPGGHAAWGVGASIGRSGVRHDLDLAGALQLDEDGSGWLGGGSFVTGFGAYPTYAALEAGFAERAESFLGSKQSAPGVLGYVLAAGPALRIAPDIAGGFSLRCEADLMFVQAGVRVVVAPFAASGTRDGQVTFTLGLGYF